MPIPKFGGRDCELSTTGTDAGGREIDAWDVTRHILRQIPTALGQFGVRCWSRRPWGHRTPGGHGNYHGYGSAASSDCLRNWTSQCYYSDLGHLECCTASALFPRTFAAQCLSVVLAAEAARQQAEQTADDGSRFALTTSNADAYDPSVSFGSHISFQISCNLWEDLLEEPRHPAVLGFVSSALAAAIPFFGAGYILPLNDGSAIYSLSARAHHLARIATLSTTEPFNRGLLNRRREPHGKTHERLHLIGFDFDLLSSPLMFSFVQCLLAAAEEGHCGAILFDPVVALRKWSWGLDSTRGMFPVAAKLIDGRHLTLPAYMAELGHVLLGMCESGVITEQVAPQAREMLPRVIELARYAEEGSLLRCARHLQWAAKFLYLTQLCREHGTQLGDAAIRLADHDFCHTDPEQGVCWRLWREGLVDPLVTLDEARLALVEGPPESRDWGRGRIIERFYDAVTDVDWSFIELQSGHDRWSSRLHIELPELDSLSRDRCGEAIERARDPSELGALLRTQHVATTSDSDPLDEVTRHLAVAQPRCRPGYRTGYDA